MQASTIRDAKMSFAAVISRKWQSRNCLVIMFSLINLMLQIDITRMDNNSYLEKK